MADNNELKNGSGGAAAHDELTERSQRNRERSKELRDRARALVNVARQLKDYWMAVRHDVDAYRARRPRGAAHWLIAVAASAGGVNALKSVVRGLPSTLQAAIVIVLHRKPEAESRLQRILARETSMPVREAKAGGLIEPGVIYIARPDRHLTVTAKARFAYVDGIRIRGVRSSANPLLQSASNCFGARAVAVVLSGSGWDATDGVQVVKAGGGRVIVQNPATAVASAMPASAIRTGAVDQVLTLEEIAPALVSIVEGRDGDGSGIAA